MFASASSAQLPSVSYDRAFWFRLFSHPCCALLNETYSRREVVGTVSQLPHQPSAKYISLESLVHHAKSLPSPEL